MCLYKHECQMTYARPHVNRILKRHPLGKEFFIIRDLILRHKTPLAAILTWRKRPIPWDGQWWIMYANRIWQELNTQSAPWPPEVIRNRKLCAEEATKRTKVLLKQLDKSKESQLIATYMLKIHSHGLLKTTFEFSSLRFRQVRYHSRKALTIQ